MVAQESPVADVGHHKHTIREVPQMLTSPRFIDIEGAIRQTKEVQGFGKMLKRYPDLEATLDREIQSYTNSIRRYDKAITVAVSSLTFIVGVVGALLFMMLLHK